jgi:upstream activation factor subunit UAF30
MSKPSVCLVSWASGGKTTGFALEGITAVRKGLDPMILPASSCRQHEEPIKTVVGRAARGAHSNWRRDQMPTKTREKKAGTGKVNALQKPLQPSEELAAVVGSAPLPRGQMVSKIWEYIRAHNLQNSENRREILADDKLRRVFGDKLRRVFGKDKVTMFEMNKHLAGHLK